ncbi:MAG TPA: spermidine/putrescine ABC transporter ATP-binding protein, partial [Oscillibacter sp.]|nr:spermidine/putrescine ABC transporter ATP-binding protein [Oscillibacter sp.]
CGKSTLLSVVSGLEPLTAGTVEVDGAPIRGPSGKVGFMPQRDQLFPWRTIRDNVTLGLTVTKKRTPETLAYADALLKRYGLWEFAGKRPSQLSG